MATKVKGLLKGIRNISTIFDEKEPEIQIGFPTDVKHVAHIGCDGPSANTPAWMNDFKSSEQASGPLNSNTASGPLNSNTASGPLNSNAASEGRPVSKPRQQTSTDSPVTSPTKKSTGGSKQGRRHRSTDADSSQGGETHVRRTRRHHHRSTNSGTESGSSEVPTVPKQSRRRKQKGSSGGASEIAGNDNQDPLSEVSFTDHGSASCERLSASRYP